MITANLNQLELTEFIARANPGQRAKATFPLLGSHGTRQSAAVYIEIDPGEQLGTHTDSAEEVLLIMQGKAEVSVGAEKATASAGELVVVPRMEPHNIRNVGQEKIKVLGFFGGANNIVATFDETWWPTRSNRVDTAALGA